MKDIRSMTLEELKTEMAQLGEKPFRAKQVYEWLHVKLAEHYDEMTNVSKALRQKLSEHFERCFHPCTQSLHVPLGRLTQSRGLH